MTLYVGTSGYSYKEWKGSFYPSNLTPKEMLSYYASRFHAVELNNTFYRFPKESMIESWRAQVPDDFRFTFKAPQTITHYRRLKGAAAQTKLVFDTVSALKHQLGAVLFRLPEDMEKDLKCLETFLKDLPTDAPAAFEFRHETWYSDDVLELLRKHNRVFVVSDRDEMPAHDIDKTADWGYLRLRRVEYSESELVEWIKKMKAQKWKDTYVFFKHEDEGTGPKLAARFIELVNKPRNKR